jgi:hypothetical protein
MWNISNIGRYSTITNDARCTRENKSSIAMANAACNKKTFSPAN